MDQIKKRVIADLLFSPWSLVPIVGGLTGAIAGWANDGPAMLFFLSLMSFVAGVGVFGSRLAFGIDNLAQKAWNKEQEAQKEAKRKSLMVLYDKLTADNDTRTSTALMDLTNLYAAFNDNVKNGDVSIAAKNLLVSKVDELFNSCVKQLENSYQLLQEQNKCSMPSLKKKLQAQREQQVKEVVQSVAKIGKIMDECMELTKQRSDRSSSSVATLSEELDATMDAARQTEQRLSSMGITSTRE